MSVEIRGAEQLAALSKALKQAGDKELQRELSRGITDAMKPLRIAIKKSAMDTLPTRGGLDRRVSRSSFRTVRRGGSRIAGVRLTAKNSLALGKLNRGTVRHPVFGNREVWVTQRVRPGWWDRPVDASAPQVRRDVIAAMDRVAKKVERSV